MHQEKTNKEIEAKFLDIGKQDMVKRLLHIGAQDLGEQILEEIIFYDAQHKWLEEKKMVRLRRQKEGAFLAYKDSSDETLGGTVEIEFMVGDADKARQFLEAAGLTAFRWQQKKRHTFLFDSVKVDIDEYPQVPAYLEIEGGSENVVKDAARALELDWDKARFESAREILEKVYKIPLKQIKRLAFDGIEYRS